jgi:hypothetical protein
MGRSGSRSTAPIAVAVQARCSLRLPRARLRSVGTRSPSPADRPWLPADTGSLHRRTVRRPCTGWRTCPRGPARISVRGQDCRTAPSQRAHRQSGVSTRAHCSRCTEQSRTSWTTGTTEEPLTRGALRVSAALPERDDCAQWLLERSPVRDRPSMQEARKQRLQRAGDCRKVISELLIVADVDAFANIG